MASGSLSDRARRLESSFASGIVASRVSSALYAANRLRSELARLGLPGELAYQAAAGGVSAARATSTAKGFAGTWLDRAREFGGSAGSAARRATDAMRGRLGVIATTESSQAYNAARTTGARATGLALMRRWDSVLDKRACPVCEGANGTLVRVNEPFPLGEPGSVHPNCRCSWSLEEVSGTGETAERERPRLVVVPPAQQIIRPATLPGIVRPTALPVLTPRPLANVIPITRPRRRRSIDVIPFPDTPLGKARLTKWERRHAPLAARQRVARAAEHAAADRDRAIRDGLIARPMRAKARPPAAARTVNVDINKLRLIDPPSPIATPGKFASVDEYRNAAKRGVGTLGKTRVLTGGPLTKQEAHALSRYTGSAYGPMRDAQRLTPEAFKRKHAMPVNQHAKLAANAETALAKARAALGTYNPAATAPAYRGLSGLTQEQAQTLAQQSVIEFDALSSASWSPNVALRFVEPAKGDPTAGPWGVLLELKHKSGIGVETLSSFDAEYEILFSKGTRFRITGRTRIDNNVLLIQAEEIP